MCAVKSLTEYTGFCPCKLERDVNKCNYHIKGRKIPRYFEAKAKQMMT